MLIRQGLQLNAADTSDQRALFRLFDTYDPKLASFQKLVNFGCSVKARDRKGRTLLHRCIRKGASFEIFKFLVNAGADPVAVDGKGNTLVHVMALRHPSCRFLSRMRTLVNMGVPTDSPNKAGLTPLHIVCATRTEYNLDSGSERRKDFLDLLLDGKLCLASNVNSFDKLGARPIHYAASFSEFHVGRLLRVGADPTLKTFEGLRPLHIAARGRQSNVIGLFIAEYRKRGILEQVIDERDGTAAQHFTTRVGLVDLKVSFTSCQPEQTLQSQTVSVALLSMHWQSFPKKMSFGLQNRKATRRKILTQPVLRLGIWEGHARPRSWTQDTPTPCERKTASRDLKRLVLISRLSMERVILQWM